MSEPAHNSKYDGVIVLLPDIARLRAGDILLTFNAECENPTEAKQSRMIRRTTGGSFSHAMMCSVPPTFIEAIGAGVSTISLARCFAHNLENVRVLRLPDAELAAKAAALVQLEVGRDYSVPRAIASVLPQSVIERITDKGIFCSALVAQVYTSVGAPQFRGIEVDKTTPATIERLPGLNDVTAQIFREALAPNNIEEMCALDGERVPSLSEAQTEINNRYAKALWPATDRLVATYPEAELEAPITLFQVIQFIMQALDSVTKIAPSRRLAFETEVAALDRQAAELLGSGEMASVLREIVAFDQTVDERNLRESFNPRPDIDVRAMRSYLETSEAQFASRKEALDSFIAWGAERSRALTAYIDYQRETLLPIERRQTLLREILGRIA